MSLDALNWLKETFPGRRGLRAEEVALVLRGRDSRGAVQKVREKMKDGRYPGCEKTSDGLWQMPMAQVAEALAPSDRSSPVVPVQGSSISPTKTGRRKSAVGPRLAQLRSMQFWAQVCRALGYQEDANELESEIHALRAEVERARDMARAEEQAAVLRKSFATDLPNGGKTGFL